MVTAIFKLDVEEKFQHLSRPPIVEAVIHWQARAQNSLDTDTARLALEQRLPQFPSCEPVHQAGLMVLMTGQTVPTVQHQKELSYGYRLVSADKRFVAQFNRDGVVFSRVGGYEHWEEFCETALMVWYAFVEIAGPLEAQRLGVRFINHIPAATSETLAEYLREPPTRPANLTLKEFVYQSTFDVPEHPYNIRVTKVLQPTVANVMQSAGLFVDSDVFSTKVMAVDETTMNAVLTQMRWLKNKVFFTLLTDQAIESFR